MFTINYSGILSGIIGERDGLTPRELDYFREQTDAAWRRFVVETGTLGFCRIVRDRKTATQAISFRKKKRSFGTVVVLGIGGSALGAKAIRALLGPDVSPVTLHVLDNVDPFTLKHVFDSLDYRDTFFFVISKSGETVETLSQFLYCCKRIKALRLNPADHFAFITDPEKGFLRELGNRDGYEMFDVPTDVGGRFSVLSSVGLLPAAFMEADPVALVKGAARVLEKSLDAVRSFSLFLYLLNSRRGKSSVVMMPYCDRLYEFSLWFSQLWAESLGKKHGLHGEIVRTGQTPVVARGVTDQHSQLQLYLEGPRDKTVVLLKSRETLGIEIPALFKKSASVEYLHGKTFDDLFTAEYVGTYGSLIQEKVPVITIEPDAADLVTLGGLFMFFELCTAFSGSLYRINPFDQPGVESGKKIAFARLGKKGFDEKAFHKIAGKLTHELRCD